MTERPLRAIWSRLQAKKPHMPHFLSRIRLQGIRGIEDLQVAFDYPVSVIAGGNASGKSTVLSAAACAYKVPGAGVRDFAPATLFPDYRPKSGVRQDTKHLIVLEFDYRTPEGNNAMRWRFAKDWNRSFFGRKSARQPERPVYLRAFGNPSGLRSASMSHRATEPQVTPLNASQINFAQQMLPFRYAEVVNLSSDEKNLLFAEQESGAKYSELHMAAGERVILRLAQEIAQIKGALVLIDEVEAGLHPSVQKLLMLHLQQLALRNDLQVIVTTHSPVVIDSVPTWGRIFLERDKEGKVEAVPPYRQVVQDALYGRSADKLNLLCEDENSEGVVRGIIDEILIRQRLGFDWVRIGRNTGVEEFPAQAVAFKKFEQINNFAFVLDGTKRDSGVAEKIREAGGSNVPVLFLPGRHAPEVWVWQQMQQRPQDTARELSVNPSDLTNQITRLNAIFKIASDTPSEIAKNKLSVLSEKIGRNTLDICRIVARQETRTPQSQIQPLVEQIETTLQNWQNQLE